MRLKIALLALAFAAAVASPADAYVIYKVDNPARDFTLFVYDSPGFITSDTLVDVSGLAFANPLNSITAVEFIPASSTYPGTSEVDVLQSAAAEQLRYYAGGTFLQFGVTPGDSNSFGFPTSELVVAAPEPGTMGIVAASLVGLLVLRRRNRKAPSSNALA